MCAFDDNNLRMDLFLRRLMKSVFCVCTTCSETPGVPQRHDDRGDVLHSRSSCGCFPLLSHCSCRLQHAPCLGSHIDVGNAVQYDNGFHARSPFLESELGKVALVKPGYTVHSLS